LLTYLQSTELKVLYLILVCSLCEHLQQERLHIGFGFDVEYPI